MLLALGMFVFSMDNALFDQLRRRRTWRHPSGDRVGARPASQFAGPGDDNISLAGAVAPGQVGRREALDELAALADAGAAYPLLDGDGYIYGAFVIEGLDETARNLGTTGAPRLIDFSIELRRVDDDAGETGAAGEPVRA
ncbi:MAG: phage tail protein [Brevundimonas sp.]|uniref:phage tail protein n=1 Tax=Brevundimonas sp. TaxID=1871086 RepID=UPI00391A0B8F